jgi:putative ABC transport system substrate-binding protein
VPFFARAQQSGKVHRVAIVSPSMPVSEMNETDDGMYGPFLGELQRLGYVEGQSLIVERFSAEGHPERYREMVSEVVRSHPDAVFAAQVQLTLELKAQTTTIPIVGGGVDPVGFGIVPSLARPGGNITGVDGEAGLQTWGKRLALLKEAVPTLSRVGLLIVPNTYGQRGAAMVKEASEKIGVSLVDSQLASPFNEAAYRAAFATMVEERAEAVYVGSQYENWTNRQIIVDLAQRYRLPAIYGTDAHVEVGGFMAYTPDWRDLWRHAADEVDQILKGTKLRDIPFYQGTKFHFAINLKTAKALGIEIPNSLLAQADEVVE